MSEGIGRRDTLKLASAAAALGAGLGVVLRARDALAGQPAGAAPAGQLQQKMQPLRPEGAREFKLDGAQQFKIDGAQQSKIDGYKKLKPERGLLQIKLATPNGQLLFASNVPDEIGQLLLAAPNGTLQVKLYRPVAQGAALAAEPFREGLMQFTPTNPDSTSKAEPAPASAPTPAKR